MGQANEGHSGVQVFAIKCLACFLKLAINCSSLSSESEGFGK